MNLTKQKKKKIVRLTKREIVVMYCFTLLFALFAIHHVSSQAVEYDGSPRDTQEGRTLALVPKKFSGRALDDAVPPCPGKAGAIRYFSIEFLFISGADFNASECTESMLGELGDDVNDLLLDYGIGEAGKADNATFLAEVCPPVPATRRRLQTRFLWKTGGGGICRLCGNGDGDHRRRLGLGSLSWFNKIFLPNLHLELRNATLETIVGNYVPCLGIEPDVQVDLKVSTKAELAGISC
jgi:hypothetical protein